MTQYMPRKYGIESTNKFINLVKNCGEALFMALLDVVSLFTNFPALQTIVIIFNTIPDNQNKLHQKNERTVLRNLLIFCTTRTPFTHVNKDLYEQMRVSLWEVDWGQTVADLNMCVLNTEDSA